MGIVGIGSGENPDVAAVILTCNARASLQRLLGALEHQTVPLAAILITDNASAEPVDDLVEAIPNASVTRLPENLGPAGGYAHALSEFLRSSHQWAWIMDDDCLPTPDALQRQLEIAGDDHVVLARVRWSGTTETATGHGWLGALVPRVAIERVGVPNAQLFWWTEDTEYLQWRLPQAGFQLVWTEPPVMVVSRGRADASKPAWKYYYETRNQIFHRLYVQRPTRQQVRDRAVPRHLTLRIRAGRAVRSTAKLTVRAGWRERSDRTRKLAMVARGAVDGLRGRLGRTVAVDLPDRPLMEPADRRDELDD